MSAVSGLSVENNPIVAAVALAVLIAIAVLISPAVPSAPRLLPVSALLLLGVIAVAAHAGLREARLLVAMPGRGQAICPAAEPGYTSTGLPLRR